MAAIQNAGLALEWVRKVTLASPGARSTRRLSPCRQAPGGVAFLPYLSGERTPRFDPDARGAWIGPRPRPHARPSPARRPRRRRVRVARGPRSAGGSGGFGLRAPPRRGGASGAGGAPGDPWRQLLADVLGRPLWLLPDEVSAVASARGARFPGRPRLRRLFLGRGYAPAHPRAREIHKPRRHGLRSRLRALQRALSHAIR